MMEAPYFSEFINRELAKTNDPKLMRMKIKNFFMRYLMQKAFSVFKWKLPKLWSKEYFLYCLYGWGFVAIIKTDKFGVIPQACGIYGQDVMYRPTHAVIANPLLRGNLTPRIGTQCTLMKLASDYAGIGDLVSFYGERLMYCTESLDMNLLNSRLSYVFTARTNAAAKSFDKLYGNILNGALSVVQDGALLDSQGNPAWQAFEQNVGQNFIAEELLTVMRKLENMFDTVVGIPNANTDKRERLIQDEANANNVETAALAGLWLESLTESCEKANTMFPGLGLSVDWRYDPDVKKGGKAGAGNNDNPGAGAVR